MPKLWSQKKLLYSWRGVGEPKDMLQCYRKSDKFHSNTHFHFSCGLCVLETLRAFCCLRTHTHTRAYQDRLQIISFFTFCVAKKKAQTKRCEK
jgi:hypothetical protein